MKKKMLLFVVVILAASLVIPTVVHAHVISGPYNPPAHPVQAAIDEVGQMFVDGWNWLKSKF